MPLINSVVEAADEVARWRQDFHRHPELLYDVHRTAGVVADKLRAFGCDEVVTGFGRTGVVGVIRGREPGRLAIGLRADMDALPITETNAGLPHVSETAGRMHACGHDGHTAMLLGAAQYLCATRAFAGTAVLVFQPAEEGGAGARVMLEAGLVARFGIDEIYGMHNLPGLPVGQFAMRAGPVMASSDVFEIKVEGRGGHAALPHLCIDPVLAGSHIVTALQMIASRNVDPLEAVVVSVTTFQAGSARNAIPSTATLGGTVRALKPETRDMAEARVREIATAVSSAHGTSVAVNYSRGYPVTVNHAEPTRLAARVAADVAGTEKVDTAVAPMMGAEDFSYMLEARPGAFVFTGNGDSAGLHNSAYDFDDRALPHGISYWARLVETAMPA